MSPGAIRPRPGRAEASTAHRRRRCASSRAIAACRSVLDVRAPAGRRVGSVKCREPRTWAGNPRSTRAAARPTGWLRRYRSALPPCIHAPLQHLSAGPWALTERPPGRCARPHPARMVRAVRCRERCSSLRLSLVLLSGRGKPICGPVCPLAMFRAAYVAPLSGSESSRPICSRSAPSRKKDALAAAYCSARFLEAPCPRPHSRSLISTATSNCLA